MLSTLDNILFLFCRAGIVNRLKIINTYKIILVAMNEKCGGFRLFKLLYAGSLTEEQARVSPNSNVITRSLGVNENVEVEIDILPYEKKDRFYLCSDGVWGTMPQKELKKQFYRCS